MKVLIVGPENFIKYSFTRKKMMPLINKLNNPTIHFARDPFGTLIEHMCINEKLDYKFFNKYITKSGDVSRAGFRKEMVDKVKGVIIFHDNKRTSETGRYLELAKSLGKKTKTIII